jgi:hypothetical protein
MMSPSLVQGTILTLGIGSILIELYGLRRRFYLINRKGERPMAQFQASRRALDPDATGFLFVFLHSTTGSAPVMPSVARSWSKRISPIWPGSTQTLP